MKQDRTPITAGEVAAGDEPRTDDGVARRYEAADDAHRADEPAPQPERVEEPSGPSRRERAGEAARTVGRGASWVRAKVAQVVWLVAVACAVVLGAAALMVALDANTANTLVAWVLDRARDLDGPFVDVFTFSGDDAATKQVLVGWALAAVAYLVVGRIAERLIKP